MNISVHEFMLHRVSASLNMNPKSNTAFVSYFKLNDDVF